MTDTQEIEDFLEHYGVKGMQWGVRKSRSGRTKFSNRSKGQKAVIIGVGAGSALLGANFVGGMTLSPPLAIAAGAGSAKVGASWAENYLDRKSK